MAPYGWWSALAMLLLATLATSISQDVMSNVISRRLEGQAGVDYPTMDAVPRRLKFNCRDRKPGFYADPETRCQVWHWCDTFGVRHSFLCPNMTVFNQQIRGCDWWYNVNCDLATSWYKNNDDLYKPSQEEQHARLRKKKFKQKALEGTVNQQQSVQFASDNNNLVTEEANSISGGFRATQLTTQATSLSPVTTPTATLVHFLPQKQFRSTSTPQPQQSQQSQRLTQQSVQPVFVKFHPVPVTETTTQSGVQITTARQSPESFSFSFTAGDPSTFQTWAPPIPQTIPPASAPVFVISSVQTTPTNTLLASVPKRQLRVRPLSVPVAFQSTTTNQFNNIDSNFRFSFVSGDQNGFFASHNSNASNLIPFEPLKTTASFSVSNSGFPSTEFSTPVPISTSITAVTSSRPTFPAFRPSSTERAPVDNVQLNLPFGSRLRVKAKQRRQNQFKTSASHLNSVLTAIRPTIPSPISKTWPVTELNSNVVDFLTSSPSDMIISTVRPMSDKELRRRSQLMVPITTFHPRMPPAFAPTAKTPAIKPKSYLKSASGFFFTTTTSQLPPTVVPETSGQIFGTRMRRLPSSVTPSNDLSVA